MQGKIQGDTFIITDAFRLPVEGTETRVNAGAEADEYQVNYLTSCRDNGRPDNVIGWYHSHPGYGCWLSGIDVSTQKLQQKFQDPSCAVVIDPDRTISAGKVEIGAFRTYPDDYKPTSEDSGDGYQSIPLNKVEDFGAHASQYYSLEVSHFKSSLDSYLLELLWNKYWVSTLSQSPLFTNRDYGSKQMLDLSQKIRNASIAIQNRSHGVSQRMTSASTPDVDLDKLIRDSNKIAGEEKIGLLASDVKAKLFNVVGNAAASAAGTTEE